MRFDLVFVAGAFRAPTPWQIEQNIRVAEEIGLALATFQFTPLIPHTMYRFFQNALPDSFWLASTARLLEGCDAVYLLPDWQQSKGSCAEKELADSLGIPCFETLDAIREWRMSRELGHP